MGLYSVCNAPSLATRKGALLDLLLVNRGRVGKVALSGQLGHSDHEVVEFETKTSTLDMERTDYRLLRELVSKVRW